MASTLDHLEKTLADAYRKEIDQEENICRSLPFFAATLGLELAALFRMIDRVRPDGAGAWADISRLGRHCRSGGPARPRVSRRLNLSG